MAKEQRIDMELLRDLSKSQNMPARILNSASRLLDTEKDKLTDSNLEHIYKKYILDSIQRFGKYRGFGSEAVTTLENYLLSKGLIDIPGHFAYLPTLESEPSEEQRYKSVGKAELTLDGSRSLIYPIGIRMPHMPTLHFGNRLDDITEFASDLDSIDIKDIEKFRRLHLYQSDSYNREDYIFRKTAIK